MPQRICARLAVASFCVFYLPINQLPYQTSDHGSGPIGLPVSFQIAMVLILPIRKQYTHEFEGERPLTPSEMSMICDSIVESLSEKLQNDQ
jgi:hypothetical protein